ncbi:MAG: PT domain-containing protein [bacterium]|nr:PT domain-containing protein [bacterium]
MWRMIIMMGIAMVALVGCGGGGTSNPQVSQNAVPPTATPFPTLVFEERVTFTAGFIQNPFRLAIRPDATIQNRIFQVLGALSPLADDELSITTPLSSLQIDDIAPIRAAFENDFAIAIIQADWDATATIGDLVTLVQRRVADQVVLEIYNRTSLYFEVTLLNSYGEGLTALCDSGTGIVTIPFLDGMTMLVALANECGDIALQVAKSPDMALTFAPVEEAVIESTPEPTLDVTTEPTSDATSEVATEAVSDATTEVATEAVSDVTVEPTADVTAEPTIEPTSSPTPAPTATPIPLDMDSLVTGTEGVFFISRTLGGQSLSVLQNRILCRLNIRDFYSWFLPNLLLEQASIEPLSIVDKPSPRALVDAVVNDECAGGMLSADQLALLDNGADVTIVERTVAFPYGVLLYPLEVELGIQLRLNEILPPMALDPQAGRPLRLLLGQTALLPITADDLDDLNAFITATGYDLSQLGR